MTVSLLRRLIDLPEAYADALRERYPLDVPLDARTTRDVLVSGRDLAKALLAVGRARGERVYVERLPAEATQAQLDGVVEAAARATVPTVKHRNGAPLVALVVGGSVRESSTRRRTRGSYRYTLDSDVADWVRDEATRRGTTSSEVVQDAVRSAMAATNAKPL